MAPKSNPYPKLELSGLEIPGGSAQKKQRTGNDARSEIKLGRLELDQPKAQQKEADRAERNVGSLVGLSIVGTKKQDRSEASPKSSSSAPSLALSLPFNQPPTAHAKEPLNALPIGSIKAPTSASAHVPILTHQSASQGNDVASTSSSRVFPSSISSPALVPAQEISVLEEGELFMASDGLEVKGYSTSVDISSGIVVPAREIKLSRDGAGSLAKELWEMLGKADVVVEEDEEARIRKELDKIVMGEVREETTWTKPVGEAPVDRQHLSFPDLEATPHGDLVVDVSSRSITYFASYETTSSVRLSSAYASKLYSVDRLLYLYPIQKDSHPYSLETRFKGGRTIMNSVQEKLITTYANLVVRWLQHCEKEHVKLEHRFPSDATEAARWLSTLGGQYSASYVRKHANALSFWHHLHLLPFSLDSGLQRTILAGCRTLAPKGRDDRRGLTVHDMLDIFKDLESEDKEKPEQKPRNAAIRAVSTTLFWGMGRIKDGTVERQAEFKGYRKEQRELRNRDVKEGRAPRQFERKRTFDPKYDSSGASFTFYQASETKPPLVSLKIPHDKAKNRKGVTLQLPQQTKIDPKLDPVEACRNHVLINEPTIENPAFSYRGNKGQRRFLTASELTKRVNEALARAGRGRVHGHSFRIGGNNVFRAAGISPEIVKGAGRWASSSSYQLYTRNAEKVSRSEMANVIVGGEEEDRLVIEKVSEKKKTVPKGKGKGKAKAKANEVETESEEEGSVASEEEESWEKESSDSDYSE